MLASTRVALCLRTGSFMATFVVDLEFAEGLRADFNVVDECFGEVNVL